MIMNCIGSLFGSNDTAQPKARVEAVGPNRQELLRLQSAIYNYVTAAQVTVSIFESKSAASLQVLLYKKGRTYQIYNGASDVDYEGIGVAVANSI
jgi:hypothetical protein